MVLGRILFEHQKDGCLKEDEDLGRAQLRIAQFLSHFLVLYFLLNSVLTYTTTLGHIISMNYVMEFVVSLRACIQKSLIIMLKGNAITLFFQSSVKMAYPLRYSDIFPFHLCQE